MLVITAAITVQCSTITEYNDVADKLDRALVGAPLLYSSLLKQPKKLLCQVTFVKSEAVLPNIV